MSRYRPLYAPTKPRVEGPAQRAPGEKVLFGLSTSVPIPELAGLSPDEVEFIDSVIQRAPATATTFLTVLKAYNDILLERGLDPQNEVVYFGKLLKLGTVKGQNWKDKWDIIKDRHAYKVQPRSAPRPPVIPHHDAPSATPRREGRTNLYNPVSTFRRPNPEYDAFTLHSSLTDEETEPTQSTNAGALGLQYHATPQRSESPIHPILALSPGTPMPTALARGNRYTHRTTKNYEPQRWDSQSSDHTDSAPTRVSTPPSYGAAVREFPPPSTVKTSRSSALIRGAFVRPQQEKHAIVPSELREPPKNVINEVDVWAKVREARDEVEAEKFRERKLVERCWDVWLQGFEWVQVGTASLREMLSDNDTFEGYESTDIGGARPAYIESIDAKMASQTSQTTPTPRRDDRYV
jgi:protein SFI1